MLKLKQIMITFATLGWVVRSSCNSSLANTSDNWNANGDLISNTAGNPHSWIVLRQTGLGATAEICIDLLAAVNFGDNCQVFFSPGGYVTTGLSTTARPATNVAGDEVQIVGVGGASGAWMNLGTVGFASFVSGMQSTDGQSTRLFVFDATGGLLTYWFFEKLQGATAGLAFPVICGTIGALGADQLIYSALTLAGATLNGATDTTIPSRARFNASTQMRCSWASEGYNTSNFYIGKRQTVVNDLSSAFPMTPIAVVADTISPNVGHGRIGTLADIWFGSTTVVSGDTYASKTFIQLDNVIIPWNGSSVSGPAGSTDRTGELIAGVSDSPTLSGHPLETNPGEFTGFASASVPRNMEI